MTDDDSTVPRWVLQPAATVREILGNNRRAVYVALAGLGGLAVTGNLPETGLPSWWPAVAIAVVAAGLAGRYAARRIMDLIPDPEGILLVEFKAHDAGGGAIYELSEEAFADMRVIGSLYQWDRSPRRVYEVREYDQRHNVAVGNWRETVPASELAEHPSVEDAMAAIRELRQDLEPDIAKARELRRRIRGIARQLDSDRAKAQDDILDEHVAPDLGNGRTVGEIVDDAIPDEIHPEEVDVEDAIEDVEPVDEDDQRHDNGDSLDEEDSPPNMADMEFYEAITDG